MPDNPSPLLGQSRHSLTGLDRPILEVLASADGEGLTLGADLAGCVEVPANAIGSRLSSLVRRGYITGQFVPEAKCNGWAITLRGLSALA